MGKLFILFGIVLVIVGVLIEYSDKIPFIGKLPGDIVINKGNLKIYFPLATSILLSLIITLVMYVVKWLKN